VTAKAQKAPPTPLTEAELRHYTPEQVYDLGLLPFKPDTLRKKAQAYEFPHNRGAMKITFKLAHIREISERFDVRPASETHPTADNVAPAA
jgi:hypothetical protein